MINVAHGISFFVDLGLSGWPHEPGRAPNRPLGCHGDQLAARVKGIQVPVMNCVCKKTRCVIKITHSHSQEFEDLFDAFLKLTSVTTTKHNHLL